MTTKYIRFGNIIFGGESYINIDDKTTYTPFIFSEFSPNEVTTLSQKDDLIIDGAVYSNFRYDARVISLTGHILPRRGESAEELRQKLYAEINGKRQSELIYYSGDKKYVCDAFGDAPVCAKPIKQTVAFNINFTAPAGVWYEYTVTEIPVATRTPNLSTPFTLPRAFSLRISDAKIYNDNKFEIFPTVTVISNSVTADGGLTVENLTTDTKIILSGYAVERDTKIEIDCKNMTAKCGDKNAINYFNDFSDFALVPGENHIKAYDSNNDSKFRVAIEFRKPYVGI